MTWKAKDFAVVLEGDQKLKQELRRLNQAYPNATAAALYQEGFAIMALSKQNTPVDTGWLRSTGYVAPPTGRDHEVELGYGAGYALPVHERTDMNFVTGGAKFLENAVYQRMAGWGQRLAKRIKENVERGIGVESISPEEPTQPPSGGR